MYLNEAGKKTQKTTKKGAGIETRAAGAEGAEGRLHSVHVRACVWRVCEGGELGGVPYPRVDQERHRKEPKVKDSH